MHATQQVVEKNIEKKHFGDCPSDTLAAISSLQLATLLSLLYMLAFAYCIHISTSLTGCCFVPVSICHFCTWNSVDKFSHFPVYHLYFPCG